MIPGLRWCVVGWGVLVGLMLGPVMMAILPAMLSGEAVDPAELGNKIGSIFGSDQAPETSKAAATRFSSVPSNIRFRIGILPRHLSSLGAQPQIVNHGNHTNHAEHKKLHSQNLTGSGLPKFCTV